MNVVRRAIRWVTSLFIREPQQVPVIKNDRKPKRRRFMNGVKVEGRIKFFNHEKGFGFIQSSIGDVFVHATGLSNEEKNKETKLAEGDRVQFQVTQGQKGPIAKDVDLLEKADPAQVKQERDQRRGRRERDHDARF